MRQSNAVPKCVPVTDADRALLDEQSRMHPPGSTMVAVQTHAALDVLNLEGFIDRKWRLTARIAMRMADQPDTAWEIDCLAPFIDMTHEDAKMLWSALLVASLTDEVLDAIKEAGNG